MKKNLKVLIADDQAMSRVLLKNILIEIGYMNLMEAEDGIQTIDKIVSANITNQPFDVVFIDWIMPKISGYEVVQKCKADEKLCSVTFVMVSAVLEPENVDAAFKAGVSRYLKKPFAAGEIKSKIEGIMADHRIKIAG
jgi:two-component system chemotaxis response regulator CheY